jgi:DNA-binding MarR family transcriptional regulator
MDKVELIRDIIELQRKADRARRQYGLDVWMNLSLTIAQLKSLFFVSNHGCTNLTKLAAALGVTPTNTTGIVDRLVKQGLVSRTENVQDRRMLLLRATGKGEELVTKLRERRRGYMSEVLSRMSVDELATLAQGLTSLIRATEAQEGENEDATSARSTIAQP